MKVPARCTALSMTLVATFIIGTAPVTAANQTYFPECFNPAPGITNTIKIKSRKNPYRVALVNGIASIPWRVQMMQSVKIWAARPDNTANIKELKIISTGSDVAAQIAAIDNFIQAGYDIIAFIAVNPKAFDGVIKRAKKAGTVLVSFDNPVDNPDVLRITPNWTEFESIKTQAVVDMIPDKKGRILEVRGVPGSSVDRDRHIGFRQVIEKYPNIEVLEAVGNWDTGTVRKVVSDSIAVHGKFDAVVCQHGCAGVINALYVAGNQIVPVGGDGENGVVKALVENHLPSVSVSNSSAQGVAAISAAIALLQGKELPSLINLPISLTLSKDFKSGVNFFPDLPNTFETVTGYPACNISFAGEELSRQDSH